MGDLDWRTVRELMALRARLRELVETAMLPEAAVVPASDRPTEPSVDIWEADSEVIVEAELPGARAGDVALRLEGDTLVLSGELPPQPEESGTFVRIERYRGPFRRAITLPVAVAGTPAATMQAGVLRVRLPKRQPARRSIRVDREGP